MLILRSNQWDKIDSFCGYTRSTQSLSTADWLHSRNPGITLVLNWVTGGQASIIEHNCCVPCVNIVTSLKIKIKLFYSYFNWSENVFCRQVMPFHHIRLPEKGDQIYLSTQGIIHNLSLFLPNSLIYVIVLWFHQSLYSSFY